MSNHIRQQIREFIAASFLFREGRDALGDDQSLLAEGLIDSTGILELVSYLENEYGIVIEDQEIVPENLNSVSQITAYVTSKQAVGAITAVAV